MKKHLIFVAGLAVFVLAGAFMRESAAMAPEFKAVDVAGKVVVVRDGEEIVISEGGVLQAGDLIKTDGDSRLDVVKSGLWGYRLLQSSECRINVQAGKPEIEMMQGNVIFNVVPGKGLALSVKTPVVVAAVRGTQFWGQVTPSGKSHNSIFAVREGKVEMTVRSSGEKLMVEKGQAMEVHGAEGQVLTRDAKSAELDAISQIESLNLEA